MLDLHAHILPGIDDGPRTLEDAVALAKALADDGVDHVVATPHIYPGVFDNTPTRIAEAFDRLRTALLAEDISLTMTWAAEVRICPEILDWVETRRLPLLNGSLVGPSTALIELPDGQIPVGTERLMGLLIDQGITPLIAHPERNKGVMEQPSRLEGLRNLGCLFQVTAGSVLGEFGRRAQTTAQRLLDADRVDVIASDAHNLSSRRPRMQAAFDWLAEHYSRDLAKRLMNTTPMSIAGVRSFAMRSGDEKIIFRDLLGLPEEPLSVSAQWLQDSTPLSEAPLADGMHGISSLANEDTWSLQDFNIDSLLNNSPPQDATGHLKDFASDRTAHEPPVSTTTRLYDGSGSLNKTHLSMSATAGDSKPQDSAPEEWQLPFFRAPNTACSPQDKAREVPPNKPLLEEQPHIERTNSTASKVSTAGSEESTPVTGQGFIATPAAHLVAMARKLQSLRARGVHGMVSSFSIDAEDLPPSALGSHTSGSIPNPSEQRQEAPVLTDVITPSVPHHSHIATRTVASAARDSSLEPVLPQSASKQDAPAPVMPQPLPLRRLAPQGFRLSELTPRDTPPPLMDQVPTTPSLAPLKTRMAPMSSITALKIPKPKPASMGSMSRSPMAAASKAIVREHGKASPADIAQGDQNLKIARSTARINSEPRGSSVGAESPQGWRLSDIEPTKPPHSN